ncbi:NAD(P)/FAD-dependent oxidoreductase [Ruegeria sp. 2012CJ41-6]|uniref:NAD(P)/FAD-dependent oxidoreductase n=2 Tax=Ruegeria spongiae TaxID=2942209 RepID=A0ABT0Q488_9RHOB|nr:NAD(P)/FAD-dependent oxidoreductase [Ruegeria spongiae]
MIALRLQDPTPFNHLPFRPFPKTWPDNAPKEILADFLTEYATALDLDVVPKTRCTGASYDSNAERWTVELQTESTTRSVTCRNLVVATGKFGKARLPDFKGLNSFDGPVQHASQFRNGAAFSGRKVAVIGAGNSAFDIAQDLAVHGAESTLVQRSPISLISQKTYSDMLLAHFPGDVGRSGRPNATERAIHAMPARLHLRAAAMALPAIREADKTLHADLSRAGLMLDDGVDGTGVFGQYHLSGTGFVIDQGAGDWIADGRIAVRTGAVQSFESGGLRLENGAMIPADAVICATGFQPFNSVLQELLGTDVTEQIGPVWGIGHGSAGDPGPWTGEQRNVWAPTNLPGLWFHGGSLGPSRFYSHLLALQIAVGPR